MKTQDHKWVALLQSVRPYHHLICWEIIIIPPPNKVGGGGILDSPCPSVCSSVHLSVDVMVYGA